MTQPVLIKPLPDDIANARILIVDDNETNILLLQHILAKRGYQQIDTTVDPTSVRELYQREQYDIILLDINMPVLDGFGVMRELNTIKGDDYLPILVLTARIDDETRQRSLLEGAKDFLTKPINRIDTLNRVYNILEVRILHKKVREQNQILEQKVRQRTQQLANARLDIIHRLGRAGEFRDNETGQHVIRISKISELMARAIGLGDVHCNKILNAAPMHDVGKIGIPDNILLKNGSLDKDEWEVMKRHTTIGATLLEGFEDGVLALAREIALNHHEKWDGSGYPRGIAGYEIPLTSRIVAICDVFDALTSKRPYKEAWSDEDALEHMKSAVGTHFDPHLLKEFINIYPEIQEIRNQHRD